MRLSCTDFTPLTPEAISFALSFIGADGTVPESVTVPSLVSTLMSVDLRPGSAMNADLTFAVIAASSPVALVPEFIAVEDDVDGVVEFIAVDEDGELGAGAAAVVSVVVFLLVVDGERWLHAAPATAVPSTSDIRIVLRWNEFILTCPFVEWRVHETTGRDANVHEKRNRIAMMELKRSARHRPAPPVRVGCGPVFL